VGTGCSIILWIDTFGNESIAALWEAESNHENHIQGQMIGIAQIGEKIMDASVQLSVCEVLAVASDVSGDLHNQRRIPIDHAADDVLAINFRSMLSKITNSHMQLPYQSFV